MHYCPPNATFYMVWFDRGFNPCFIDTVIACLLGTMMFIFGNAELWMYCRYSSRIDSQLSGRPPRLFIVQVVLTILLVFLPFLSLALRYFYGLPFYGYGVLYNVMFVYNWSLSLVLLYFECRYDLPSPPSRGHSVTLNIFWASSFSLESLLFINFNSKKWFFIIENTEDRILLCIFVTKWLLLLTVFVLGLLAPGMVSAVARGQFEYKRLSETMLQYGSGATSERTNEVDQQQQDQRAKIKEELNGKNLLIQFRSLSRQTPGVSFSVARSRENRNRNRYTNVLPYDYNRVVLNSNASMDNDYINASFVTVRIPELDDELRYIASQGPVPDTISDFWQMVWEQKVHTIVMLTDLHESDMEKCSKYWPDLDESREHNKLLVSCIGQKLGGKFDVREFCVIHVDTQHEQNVTQVCFTSWPDHGVPSRPQLFLEFVEAVSRVKPENLLLYSSSTTEDDRGRVPPTLVHCSAGTGRTGVYILLNALMRMIDGGLPVRPVEMVKCLRNQRMGMVQTDEQFLFACETALVFAEKRLMKS